MKTAQCCKVGSKKQSDLNITLDYLNVIREPNRLKILCLLKSGEKCVCDIWESLGIAQNLASHHLKTLQEAGLIISKQEGRKVIYSSNKKEIYKKTSLLNNFITTNL